eukprot:4737964-Pyramimonas_sp.AAC.1
MLALRSTEVDGTAYTDPYEKLDALTRYWAPISAAPQDFPARTRRYAERFVHPCSFDGLAPPSLDMLQRVFVKLAPSRSSPG